VRLAVLRQTTTFGCQPFCGCCLLTGVGSLMRVLKQQPSRNKPARDKKQETGQQPAANCQHQVSNARQVFRLSICPAALSAAYK